MVDMVIAAGWTFRRVIIADEYRDLRYLFKKAYAIELILHRETELYSTESITAFTDRARKVV